MNSLSLAINNNWIWIAIAGLVIYTGLAFLLYYKTNPPLGKPIRIILGIMRYLALVIILICLLEPVFSMSSEIQDDPYVVIMADDTRSLMTVEEFEGKANFVNELYSGEFDNYFKGDVKLDHYLFSDTIYSGEKVAFEGMQTAIGENLQNISDIYKDKNLSAIVLASDGLSNFGIDPVEASRKIAVPVYTVDLGPQRIARDLRIVEINHDAVAYAKKDFDFEVELEGRGFDQTSIPVVVRSQGRELIRKNVTVLGGSQRQKVQLQITPPEAGILNFDISIPLQADEELTDNNQRSFSLKVLKSKKRILLVTHKLNWETTFLKRTIEKSEDFEISLVIIDDTRAMSPAVFPNSTESMNKFDLIIFSNCSNNFLENHVRNLENYLTIQGGAIWYLFGSRSERIPSQLSESDCFPYDGNARIRYYNDFPFHLELTEEGRIHPVTRLVENSRDNITMWQNLPPFEEHISVINLKSGAEILAIHPEKDLRGNPLPMIFYLKKGKGKLLSFNMGPVWKTGFLNVGFGGDDNAYIQLIMNSINWLTTEEDIDPVRLRTDQSIYKSGESVNFDATVLDENYKPLENSVVEVIVKSDQNSDSLIATLSQESPGEFRANLGLLPSGDYTYSGTVMWEDKVIKQISGDFKVEGFSLEEETLFLPPDMLSRISQASGGKTYTPDNFENITDDIELNAQARIDTSEFRWSQNIWILIIILALLSIEWLIRKRMQLL